MEHEETLGQYIARHMRLARKTPEEAAKAAGIGRTTFGALLNDVTQKPDLPTLYKVATALSANFPTICYLALKRQPPEQPASQLTSIEEEYLGYFRDVSLHHQDAFMHTVKALSEELRPKDAELEWATQTVMAALSKLKGPRLVAYVQRMRDQMDQDMREFEMSPLEVPIPKIADA